MGIYYRHSGLSPGACRVYSTTSKFRKAKRRSRFRRAKGVQSEELKEAKSRKRNRERNVAGIGPVFGDLGLSIGDVVR
jgi:hypothetical protein